MSWLRAKYLFNWAQQNKHTHTHTHTHATHNLLLVLYRTFFAH